MQKKYIAIFIGIVLTGVIGKSWLVFGNQNPDSTQKPESAAVDPGAAKPGAKAGGKPATVAVTPVRADDIRVYQKALGAVNSFATVAIKSRVSGQLEKVGFKEGQLVSAGDVLAEIDARPYQAQLVQTEGQQLRNKALLTNAQADLERYRALREQDSIAIQQVDAQAALVEQYKGAVLTDKGLVDNARLQVGFARIIAPISGRVGLRQIDTGNNITTSDTITVVNQVSPIAVTFTVPEEKVNDIYQRFSHKAGAELLVEAWDKGNAKLIAKGRLLTLDNQIDPLTGTIKLKASFDNKDGVLFPNQFVNVRLLLDTLKQVPILPVAAIQHGRQGDFVYVVGEENKLRLQPVKTGAIDGENIAVLEGVKLDEKVVISGVDKLRDGAKVNIAEGKPGDGRKKQGRGKDAPEQPGKAADKAAVSKPHAAAVGGLAFRPAAA